MTREQSSTLILQLMNKDEIMSAITFARKHLNNARFPSDRTRKTQLWDVSGFCKVLLILILKISRIGMFKSGRTAFTKK